MSRAQPKLKRNKKWPKLSKRYLAANPNCVKCKKPAKHVDHILSLRTNPHLEMDWNNLRSLCISCHSRRTAQEEINDVVYGAGHDGYPIHSKHPWNKIS